MAITNELIDAAANIDALDSNGCTPLMLGAAEGDQQVLCYLVMLKDSVAHGLFADEIMHATCCFVGMAC